MRLRFALFTLALLQTTLAVAQSWSDAYDKALAAARGQDWVAARAAFEEAIASRPDDQPTPTTLPGPVTDPKKWRNGAPYSPNFGVAYANYRIAMTATPTERRPLLETARASFETLVEKGQLSPHTAYLLNQVYGALGQPDKQRELGDKVNQGMTWKVDTVFMAPEEVAVIGSTATTGPTNNQGVVVSKGNTGPQVTLVDTYNKTTLAGPVPVVATKFALVIGNSETQMSTKGPAYAATDAVAIKEALVQNAGYADGSVDVVVNATADQIRTAAKALADRMPADATLLLYFTGIGVNIDGKDYYAGIDAAMTTDTGKMVSKEEVMSIFRSKGARIFAFHQADRPIVNGRYFGMETPIFGYYALCQATSPDRLVYGTTVDGKVIGAYTKAFVDTLAEFRSNRVPVTEFVWKIFQMMQGGSTLEAGGGTNQVPSLPILRNLAPEARF